jgi:site-specific DNA-methyltransferase (adenine-specific)
VTPYFDDGQVVIYHGDCREILPTLPAVELVLTDPPYGMAWDGKISPGRNGHSPGLKSSSYGLTVAGDDAPFDPTPWLAFPHVILWGSNHFASRLPTGTTLVWVKRHDDAFGSFLSDAEIAWMQSGRGVYCWRDVGYKSEERWHPTQKPIGLMRWCIQKAQANGLILDPYMGAGTTLRAAKDMGRRCVGIEIEERYCEIAARRLQQQVLPFEVPA